MLNVLYCYRLFGFLHMYLSIGQVIMSKTVAYYGSPKDQVTTETFSPISANYYWTVPFGMVHLTSDMVSTAKGDWLYNDVIPALYKKLLN